MSINEEYAYVELDVYGAYPPDRLLEVVEAMRGLHDRHGHFSELEVHHGKVEGWFSSIQQLAKKNPDMDMTFMSKLKKYALVSDHPSWFIRIVVFLTRFGSIKMRIFPMHEREQARQWIQEPDYTAQLS